MSRRVKVGIWAGVIAAIAAGLAVGLLVSHRKPIKPLVLEGAVIRQSSQADKEQPLSDVEVTATDGLVVATARSDSSGFFKLTLPIRRRPDAPVTLNFRRPGYLPLELPAAGGRRRRKRISQRASFVHCGPLSLYKNHPAAPSP